MKKGGVREINSFISVSNTPSNALVDRRKVSSVKVTASKSDTSKIEKNILTKSPAVKDGLPPRPAFPNKKTISDAPRQAIGSSSSQVIKTEKNAQLSKIKSAHDPSSRDMRLDRNAQLSRSNSIREESNKLMARRTSQLTLSDISLKKSVKSAQRKPSIPLKAAKVEYPTRKDSISSIPKTETTKLNTYIAVPVLEKPNRDENYEYEDDFEDYESDFESLSESPNSSSDDDIQANTKVLVEEEKKMDSGSYDLTYLHQLQKQKKQLEVIREALNKENTIVQQSANSVMAQNMKFDSIDALNGSDNTNILLDFNTRSMESFASAKKRQQNSKMAHKIASRGERLLQMITLDSMNFSLFEMSPVPYHIFMRSYARKNTTQAFTQTNEDNISCEIQTENIFYQTKWTQHPVVITKQMLEEEENLSEIIAGVGEEGCDLENKNIPTLNINTSKLIDFMKLVGEEIISLLEEEQFKIKLTEEIYRSKNSEISECVSCVKIESISFLLKRPILFLLYDPCNNARVLTIHGIGTNENENDRHSYLCIWNIHQFWKPKFILKSHNRVTSCCFTGYDSSFVVAGHEDGSICVWNLRENLVYSDKISVNNTDISARYPSFNTAEKRSENLVHNSRVISVESTKSNNVDLRNINEIRFEKVFSIDEMNILIVWSLSPGSKTKVAPWCKINFFIDQILDINQKLPK
ncbi:hypothetical protein V9T40_010390 [Parthenolecanium corni]|uniref:WD repeat-containing protein 78 n=1 Tax=Parthenolecanium corni TaxID=536013 RepID=A0AAN9Y1D2_9HEMI